MFQPKVDLQNGACDGVEALLRWTHAEEGFVSPGEFIPIVESTSLARATTEWVLAAAMRQLAAWREQGVALQVAVNVSAVNLEEPDFCERVLDGLERQVADPAAAHHPDALAPTLEAVTVTTAPDGTLTLTVRA